MNDLIVTDNRSLVPLEPLPVGSQLCIAIESFAAHASSYGVNIVEAFVTSGVAAQLGLSIEQASRSATRPEIGTYIGTLVGCYPIKPGEDLTAYAERLVVHVVALKPSLLALELARWSLEKNSKWRPAISEVIDAIEEAKGLCRRARQAADALPSRLAEYSKARAEQDERCRENIALCEEQLKRFEPNDPADMQIEIDGYTRARLEMWLVNLRKVEAARSDWQGQLFP